MNKGILITIITFLVLISALLIILLSSDNTQVPGSCSFVYKVNNYSDYIYGQANNRTGEYKLMASPLNVNDKELTNNYYLQAGIGCYPEPNEWVVLNVTKDEYNDYSSNFGIIEPVSFEEFYLCNNGEINLTLGKDDPIIFFNNLVSSGTLEKSCNKLI